MWNNVEDPRRSVDASRRRILEAFEAWQRANGRAERGSQVSSSELFFRAVESSLDLSRSERPKVLGIPKSRSAWSNWRAGRGNPLVKLRFDVCRALMALTGVDVTSNGFLKTAPSNTTDVVTLGAVRAIHCRSNAGIEKCEIVVSSVEFRVGAPKEITLDLVKPTQHAAQGKQRIGSVRYALKQATVFVRSSSPVQAIATYLCDGTASELGSVSGLELSVDSEEVKCWRVQPPFPKEALQARVSTLKLCNVSPDPSAEVVVGVSVARSDIEPSITLDQLVTLKNNEYQNTRERLIAQILRNRLADPGVGNRFILSHATAVAE